MQEYQVWAGQMYVGTLTVMPQVFGPTLFTHARRKMIHHFRSSDGTVVLQGQVAQDKIKRFKQLRLVRNRGLWQDRYGRWRQS